MTTPTTPAIEAGKAKRITFEAIDRLPRDGYKGKDVYYMTEQEQTDLSGSYVLASDYERLQAEKDLHESALLTMRRTIGEGYGSNMIAAINNMHAEIGRLQAEVESLQHLRETGDAAIKALFKDRDNRDAEIKQLLDRAAAAEARATTSVDMLLFCPACGEQHVDQAFPDVCETCGVMKRKCCCGEFTAWLNPPHKSHRCNFCNHVWRPADVPTNGVLEIKTKGERDGSAIPASLTHSESARQAAEAKAKEFAEIVLLTGSDYPDVDWYSPRSQPSLNATDYLYALGLLERHPEKNWYRRLPQESEVQR